MKPLRYAGDPKGIGPEVVVRALRALPEAGPVRLLGDVDAIRGQKQLVGGTLLRGDGGYQYNRGVARGSGDTLATEWCLQVKPLA